MKRIIFGVIGISLFLGLIGVTGVTVEAKTFPCGLEAPLAGVYDPARLHIIKPCVRVTGFVTWSQKARDGDIHIELLPDPASRKLLNTFDTCYPVNLCPLVNYKGELVVEIVPTHLGLCGGIWCGPSLPIPPVGAHVYMWGPWVLDTDHGWNEVHPLKSWGYVSSRHYKIPANLQHAGKIPDDGEEQDVRLDH